MRIHFLRPIARLPLLLLLAALQLQCQRTREEPAEPPASAPTRAAKATAGTAGAAPSAGSAEAPAKVITAAAAAKTVIAIVREMGAKDAKVVEATGDGALFRVTWQSGGEKPKKQTAWVSRDGRYLTANRVDIGQRTAQLKAESQFADCLASRGLKVFADPGDRNSAPLINALGSSGGRLLVDCGGRRTPWCKALGHESLPALQWAKGAEIGVRDRAWLERTFDCALPKSTTVAAPPKVEPQELGRRIRDLHAEASSDSFDLAGIWRDGDVWHVALIRRGDGSINLRATASSDGRWLLEDPMHTVDDRDRLARQRGWLACLGKANARLYVDSRIPASMRWLTSLGPLAVQLTIDCVAEKGRPLCQQAAIEKVPTIIVGEQRLSWPFERRDVEALTGCK